MTEFKPGDIVRISMPSGHRCVQIIHQRPGWPEVLRILGDTGDPMAEDAASIAARPTVAIVMMPLAHALERGELEGETAGQAPVPEKYRTFPIFRNAVRGKQGEILYWWMWDGDGLSYIPDPDAVDPSLPIREVTSPARLIELMSAA